MDERMRFVIRLKDGDSMASLCREFGISTKTGYKILQRYEECGLEGLTRRPLRYANQLPEHIEARSTPCWIAMAWLPSRSVGAPVPRVRLFPRV